MKRTAKLCLLFLLQLWITTGCWNLKEPDQLSYVTGNGLDLTKDGKLEASTLIVVPTGVASGGELSGGEKNQSFHVISATGTNVTEAIVNIQAKLSRVVFQGHREIFLIGQRMAEHGIGETIDPFLRNAQSHLQSLIYVVKNRNAKDVFSDEPMFEPYISTALEKEQTALGFKPYLARELIADTMSDGTQPLLPAVSLNSTKHFSYSGSAILNKDDGVKLVGFLNRKESYYATWITDRLTNFTLTSYVPKGDGNVSLRLEKLGRRIRVKKVDERIQADIHLIGEGTIIENNTKLDPSKRKDLLLIQDELGHKTQKSAKLLVKKVQNKYKMDIFGLGESVHQQYPQKWKTLKRNWAKTFPTVDVSVKVDLQINDPGITNSSSNKP
ncbi:Ger(x)C family spore germination protein [Neobacillus sp. KR4-4]|uniref:Ger(x)C family spore germination protein n=1 Tax=Neobacillus sp. KR4-4 TaxID=3344872 RepID=UPI0035CAF8E2